MKFKPIALSDAPVKRPLRLISELAEDFGVTTARLARLLTVDPRGPRPLVKTASTCVNSAKSYYDPVAVRAWWAKQKEQQHA